MSTAAQPPSTAVSAAGAARPAAGWLFGPWLDLFFVANVAWPLVAWFVAGFADSAAHEAFGFLLAFFIIMPHRWITLALVFGDKGRLGERPGAYLGVLLLVVMACSTIRLSMPTLAVLVAVDYLWNAWHFAAQHTGIARIYGRMTPHGRQSSGQLEKVLLRAFFLYVLLRLTGMFVPPGSVPWLDWAPLTMNKLAGLDFAVLLIPVGLLAGELLRFRPEAAGRCVYLISVYALYATLLMALHYGHGSLVLGCAAATTLFHSTEYLAVVSWAVPKNRGLSQSRVFARLVPRWTMSLLAFMAFFALSAYFVRERYLHEWIWINLVVSLLHYAYDGMIWKRRPERRPEQAQRSSGVGERI